MLATEEELACLVHNASYNRLVCLNDVKARLYMPVTIFLSVLIVVGTLGNSTVCLVYWRRRSSRMSSNYFILSLAILDLVTCVIGMPTEIADLLLPYTFRWPLACKILRFTHSSTIIASSTILIEVAFDRYYRICQLGRQFTVTKAKLLCLGAVFLGVVCSWPTFILFGRKTVTRDLDGIIVTGSDCSTADAMIRTIYPTVYYIFLFTLFGLTITFFAVLYSQIGLAVLHRKRVSMGSTSSSTAYKNQKKQDGGAGDFEAGDGFAVVPGKIQINVIDMSSSEMSSEHHHHDDNNKKSKDANECNGIENGNVLNTPTCYSNSSSNIGINSNVNNKRTKSGVTPISRSVSACTMLSSLTGSLERSGKRRSQLSRAGWYTIQPSVTANEEDVDSTCSTTVSLEGSLGSEERGCGHADVRSRASSMNKIVTLGHHKHGGSDGYKSKVKVVARSAANMTRVLDSCDPGMDIRCNSDRICRESTASEDGLLASLQKFNEVFNKTFNTRKAAQEDTEEILGGDGHVGGGSAGVNTDPLYMQAGRTTDHESAGYGGEVEEKKMYGEFCNLPESATKSKSFGEIKLNRHEREYISGSLNMPPVPGETCSQINGFSNDFINQLNMCVSNSRLNSLKDASALKSLSTGQHNLSGSRQQKSEITRTTVNYESNSNNRKSRRSLSGDETDDNSNNSRNNECDQFHSLVNYQPHHQQQEQQQNQPQQQLYQQQIHHQHQHQQHQHQQQQHQYQPLLSPSALKRKISSALVFTWPPSRQTDQPNVTTIRQTQRQVRVGKTTTVLFAVTLAYILSFLPYLTVMVLRSVVKDLEQNLSPLGELAYKLCVKSFFINNAINPLIYSFLNHKFRSDARLMLRRMFAVCGCCRRGNRRSNSGAGRSARARVRVPSDSPESP